MKPRKTTSFFLFFVLAIWSTAPHCDDATQDPSLLKRQQEAATLKAEADAKTAMLTYENQARPASGLTGKVDVKTSAGQIEANVLSAKSLTLIAREIVRGTLKALKNVHNKNVVLIPGTQGAQFNHWQLFNVRLKWINDSIKTHIDTLNSLTDRYNKLVHVDQKPASSGKHGTMILEGVTVTGTTLFTTLSSASKLLSYAMSDYEVGGIAVPTMDDQLLVAAVASDHCDLDMKVPTLLPSQDSITEVSDKLDQVDAGVKNALKDAAQEKTISKDLQTRAKKDKSNAAKLNELAADYDSDVATTASISAAYDAFIKLLASTESSSSMPLNAVLSENALGSALNESPYALFLHVDNAAGSYYTKKNLWTAFGGMPFYVAGGAVAHYILMDYSDGSVLAGGAIPVKYGYQKASAVAEPLPTYDCTNLN